MRIVMAKDEKQARLAEALRANLRRRKAQARAVSDTAGPATRGAATDEVAAPVEDDGISR